MKNFLVSVIIPTYNYAEFIAETISCLQQQSYATWEAIVIDDGSTDHTAEVVKRILATDQRIQYYYQANQGLPAARNAGVEQAKGNYIQFLDADDLIAEDKLLEQVAYMEAHQEVDISYTSSFFFVDKTMEKFKNINLGNKEWMPKLNAKGMDVLQELVMRNIMPVNAALIRKEVVLAVGPQCESYKSLEDWEFWTRCALHNCFFAFIEHEAAFALVRVHGASMSKNKDRMVKMELKLREKMAKMISISAYLSEMEKNALLKLNSKKIQDSHRTLIIKAGFFHWGTLRLVYQKFGLANLLRIYGKALNEVRRNGRN